MVQLSETFLMESQSLDKDHQKLVEMVNEITQMLDRDETENCKTKVVDFIKFVKSHFAREEQLLNKVGYPNVEKHQKHHKELYPKMNHMLEFAELVAVNEKARESLKKELVFFVMDDVITTDLDFKKFISGLN
jgi:hemerythrin